jgi:Na+-driven multidrug efflux pump
MTTAAITNIVLDAVAVFVLGWGIAGAAAATVAAQCLSGGICAVKIFRTPQLRFERSQLLPQREVLTDLLKVGTPVAAKNIAVAAGGMVVLSVVNTLGTTFIAGFTASSKLYGVLEIAALSYGFAVNTYVGQNYGAGRMDRIRSGMKSAIALALGTSLAVAAIMFLLGRSITMLFISTENPAEAAQAGQIAYRYLQVMAGALPVLYVLYLLLFSLQGLGDTVQPMLSGLVELALRIAVSVAVAYTGYAAGIFAAEPAAWVGSTVYLWYHYRKKMKT